MAALNAASIRARDSPWKKPSHMTASGATPGVDVVNPRHLLGPGAHAGDGVDLPPADVRHRSGFADQRLLGPEALLDPPALGDVLCGGVDEHRVTSGAFTFTDEPDVHRQPAVGAIGAEHAVRDGRRLHRRVVLCPGDFRQQPLTVLGMDSVDHRIDGTSAWSSP